MNLYNQEELDRISKIKETNDKLEEFFNGKRDEWNKNINPLFDVLRNNWSLESAPKIIEIQSMALSNRQSINEQISFFLNKRSKEEVKIKKLKQDKFVFYATGFGLKTNLGEKALLIDAHIAENDRNIQLIENYIEFLRSCSKNLESLGYTIKNIIELMNYLGK
jgi:tRNA(Ser,Leu) C12 N-acetylase TAN1